MNYVILVSVAREFRKRQGQRVVQAQIEIKFLPSASWMGVWTSHVGRLWASRLRLTTANCARNRLGTLFESGYSGLKYAQAGRRLLRQPCSIRFSYSSTRPHQMSLDKTLSALAALSIEPNGSLFHAAARDPTSWKAALDGAPQSTSAAVPLSYKLTKTLVFKPKTAKTATPVPVVVIASDETDTKNSAALGKRVNQKELRLAGDDLIQEFFALDKDSRA